MSTISDTVEIWDFNRDRTLATLDEIGKLGDPQQALAFRPSDGRAHIAWQLMHIGITEELFATERLLGTTPEFPVLVPRFKGGSTPDDDIPTLEQIREVLNTSRLHLKSTVSSFSDDDLNAVPESFRERGWPLGKILQVLAWHEPHHQGQAHATLNIFKTANG